jgi:hypothetical protein
MMTFSSLVAKSMPTGIAKWGNQSLAELKGLDGSGPKRVSEALGSSVWAQSRCQGGG